MTRLTRSITAAAGLLAVCATLVIGAGAVSATSSGRPDSGTTYAAITHTVGKVQFAAGNSTDKVLGKGAVTFELTVGFKPGKIAISGTVTVFSATGSLTGTDTADLTVATNGSVTFANGKLKLTKGTGGQKGHRFIGTFTGTAKSVAGPFVFHEQGTYK